MCLCYSVWRWKIPHRFGKMASLFKVASTIRGRVTIHITAKNYTILDGQLQNVFFFFHYTPPWEQKGGGCRIINSCKGLNNNFFRHCFNALKHVYVKSD